MEKKKKHLIELLNQAGVTKIRVSANIKDTDNANTEEIIDDLIAYFKSVSNNDGKTKRVDVNEYFKE